MYAKKNGDILCMPEKDKNMKKSSKLRAGSLVLFMLICMTALVVVMHTMLRSSTYLVLLAQERKKT